MMNARKLDATVALIPEDVAGVGRCGARLACPDFAAVNANVVISALVPR